MKSAIGTRFYKLTPGIFLFILIAKKVSIKHYIPLWPHQIDLLRNCDTFEIPWDICLLFPGSISITLFKNSSKSRVINNSSQHRHGERFSLIASFSTAWMFTHLQERQSFMASPHFRIWVYSLFLIKRQQWSELAKLDSFLLRQWQRWT